MIIVIAMEQSLIIKKLSQFEEDMKWITLAYEKLKDLYPDEWVAVLKKEVIDHDKDLNKLMKSLEAKYPEDYGHIAVKFIGKEKIELIL
jgi:hypothetical protein